MVGTLRGFLMGHSFVISNDKTTLCCFLQKIVWFHSLFSEVSSRLESSFGHLVKVRKRSKTTKIKKLCEFSVNYL